MKEWDVYVDGRFVGTVHEKTEALARLAALSKYDLPNDADLSVSRR